MDIQGKNALVLGGFGLVGNAVCRELLAYEPAQLVVTSLRKQEAEDAVARLKAEFPKTRTKVLPAWGDIFLRAEWQSDNPSRAEIMQDAARRRRLVADTVDDLSEEILESSLLFQTIQGKAKGLNGQPAHIVVDCINTSTAVAYQNIYAWARKLQSRIAEGNGGTEWPEEVEHLLAALYIPQLVRHIQILHEAMLRAGTQAYVKVGTSGTGGMGLNIPYTHGEEKPSRVLMSKAAMAGAQTLLTFLMARTPGGPTVVKEIKPTALIAWKEIGYGPIGRGGRDFLLYDCPPSEAVSIEKKGNLQAEGDFGKATGKSLEAVYIDTGENGLFAAGDFSAITAYGQMEFVTPEEIAHNVVREIMGGNTGQDVIGALDGAVMGPSFRAGMLREVALERLRQLSEQHGESVAFEILGPAHISKLLFEAFILKKLYGKIGEALKDKPGAMSGKAEALVSEDSDLRQQMVSVGLPILLSDGKRLLRGPVIKAASADEGWIDLTEANMRRWVDRLKGIQGMLTEKIDTSSNADRVYPSMRRWSSDDSFDIGEMVAWISLHEEEGRRGKQ